ncbi:fatty acid--CoA ligase family protein [Lysinibacillus sp. M3]|uniref:Fatty acid--CoA ligase family protein n=1 Tax=Lysinibacillus zambalensis TaxID=3160866 RepID=A0ABV1MWE9_9BACI
MNKIFLVYDGKEYHYKDLLNQLNNLEQVSPYIYEKSQNPFYIFSKILHSIVFNYSIEILDGDFSENDLQKININKENLEQNIKLNYKKMINTVEELIEMVKYCSEKWDVALYTSGTTGLPKKIIHNFESLTRNVKVSEKHNSDVWGFAYNPTHMAGLQVFFQAFLNLNTIVYLFGKKHLFFKESCNKFCISHISSTPTFLNFILSVSDEETYQTVKRVTFGGEKLPNNISSKINYYFPNAKVRNIYASTEFGSILESDGEWFKIPVKFSEVIKIVDNELFINTKLMNNNEEGWFATGDLVEQFEDGSFKFSSRNTDIINVGGYNVNPLEIEDLLLQLPYIQDAVIYSKPNSLMGNILAAKIILINTIDTQQDVLKNIKKYLRDNLQNWKVPRVIEIVEDLEKNRTGKKVR